MEQKGRVNAYVCTKCGYETVTINAEDGVTPFIIRCRAPGHCDGEARSLCYNTSQSRLPSHEWYSPDEKQFARLDEATKEHCEQGGLLLRALDPLRLESYGYRTRHG